MKKKEIKSNRQQTNEKAETLRIKSKQSVEEMKVKKWLAIRKEAGRKIDPETAEVCWIYAQTFDPYGIYPELPEMYQQVGREYFARSPGSDIWVLFRALPGDTSNALWEKHKRCLAFPAGLPSLAEIDDAILRRKAKAASIKGKMEPTFPHDSIVN